MPTDDETSVPYAVFASKDVDFDEVKALSRRFVAALGEHVDGQPDKALSGKVFLLAVGSIIAHIGADNDTSGWLRMMYFLRIACDKCYDENQHLKLRGGGNAPTSRN